MDAWGKCFQLNMILFASFEILDGFRTRIAFHLNARTHTDTYIPVTYPIYTVHTL